MNDLNERKILTALKARFELDAGLGVDFAACEAAASAALDGAVSRVLVQLAGRSPSIFHRTSEAKPVLNSTPELAETREQDLDRFRSDVYSESVRSLSSAALTSQAPERAAIPSPMRPASLVPFAAPKVNPEKEALFAGLYDEAMTCQRCGLCAKRNSVVWGEGSLDAPVMFIGEGPGRDEDLEGRPFVGRSGRLLTDIIEKGMQISRNEVYIANVVKCRPPGNRDPKPEEVAACSVYLTRQIQVVSPKVIVAVGGVAGCALLGLPPRSPGLRGKWRDYQGIPLRVIFHPSYLLRQRRNENDRTSADRETWKDIQEVMKMASS